jgi:hypothetical protein
MRVLLPGTVVALVLTAVPSASASQRIDLQTATGANGGSASVKGKMRYTGDFGWRTAFFANDRCPADGYGTYFRGIITRTDGSVRRQPWFAADDRGCERKRIFYVGEFRSTKKIRYLVFQVCERDLDVSPPRRGDCDRSSRKYNPYVR